MEVPRKRGRDDERVGSGDARGYINGGVDNEGQEEVEERRGDSAPLLELVLISGGELSS